MYPAALNPQISFALTHAQETGAALTHAQETGAETQIRDREDSKTLI